MSGNPDVLALLEEILNSGKTPEEVCRDCSELLPEVRRRWEDFQLIDGQLRTLLPGLGTRPAAGPIAPPGSVLAPPEAFGRYQVRGALGEGGFGAVYLGHDTQLDRPVAVKVLRGGASPAQVEDGPALQEARRLAQLRHPGIVAVHDVGVQEGQVYIVSDYLDGPDLGRWLRDQRPTWPEAASIAAAVADALAHAHARLIIHRDVKPANILLTADRAPVLVDFGLALDETQAGGVAKGVISGTPWYMSPEQAAGAAHRIDGRTDIYSLGVVLYELLTGRVPFRASNLQELFRQVRDDEPQPPRQLVGDIPPELERVCLKALAKRQQDRCTTAADFADDLRRVLQDAGEESARRLTPVGTAAGESRPATPPTPRPGAPSPVALRPELAGPRPGGSTSPPIPPVDRHTVGREKELTELGRAFESAAAGQGLFLCVTGEPGIGKTTLVEDFVGELATAGRSCALARGRCSERLSGTEAYLPILEALESLLHGEVGEAAVRAMKAIAPNWYTQVVTPAGDDSSLVRVLAESKAASQERLKRELVAFLQEVSHLRPLLIFLDDLHWADASTVDLLAYLGGKCAGMRALFVLTYRPTDLALGKHPFGPVKLELQARGVCREVTLEFLTRPDLDRYLALEFPEHGFPEEFAALVHARTEGSPLFMVDLLRYLRDRQVLTQEGGRWALGRSVPDLQRDLPESVRAMIRRKIDQLGEDDRWLLVAASVQGCEFDSAVVARVLQRDAAEVEERLDELDRVHAFVRAVREQEFPDRTLTLRYRFVHALYQNDLYASLRPTRRVSLSASVAQTLLGFYGEKSEEVAAELAWLLEAARDFSRAADYFLVAARNATRVFANQEAVLLARRGVDLLASLPDTLERARKELSLQITLGTPLMATMGFPAPEVERTYRRAHELCRQIGETPDLFPALYGLWLFHTTRAEFPAARNLGEVLLSLAQRAQDPALLLQAHHALGPTDVNAGDWASAQRHLEQCITLYDPREHRSHAFLYGGHDPGACCLGFAAQSLWMLGYPDQALEKGRKSLALARELSHPYSLAWTRLQVGTLHQFRRDGSETQEQAEALQRLSDEQGLPHHLAAGSILRGWALAEQGHGDEGLALMRQGLDASSGSPLFWRVHFLALLAEVCGRAGEIEEGLNALAEALRTVDDKGIGYYEPELHRLKGELLLARGPENSADAEACFRQAVAIAHRQRAKTLELRAVTSLSRLYHGQGRQDEARPILAEIYGWFTEGFDTVDLREAEALLQVVS